MACFFVLMKTYSELQKLKTFKERFDYLRTTAPIGDQTFGFDRYLNQAFYKSKEWQSVRNKVILRDNGCDLGIEGHELYSGQITIHHMNPISAKDITDRNPDIMNPEYLICVSKQTHNAIHYGDESSLPHGPAERKPNDTCPWR